MVAEYIGLPYDLHNRNGLNCWALVALVYRDLFDLALPDYRSKSESYQDIVAAFTTAFAEGEHGFAQVSEPQDLCVVVMKHRRLQHCGLWYQGRVLHAASAFGQVVLQSEKDACKRFDTIEYWARIDD